MTAGAIGYSMNVSARPTAVVAHCAPKQSLIGACRPVAVIRAPFNPTDASRFEFPANLAFGRPILVRLLI
jgi:hypothetical protein